MSAFDLSAEQQQRHAEVYADPAVLAFEWNWLDERLAAGRNPLTAADIAELARAGITHILDLREAQEWSAPSPGHEAVEFSRECGLERHHFPLTNREAPREEELFQASAWLESALGNPKAKVYVHCRAGMERTATIVVAFHGARTGQSYDAALDDLKRKRPIFQPLPHQESAVRAWLNANSAAAA
jgi:atypical dual specificity phosphatase